MTRAKFDRFTASYDAELQRALSVTGESKEYYARARVAWTRERIRRAGGAAERVLDFGCGTGANAPILAELLGAKRVTGVDVSAASIAQARREHQSSTAQFLVAGDFVPDASYDLAFCNGVFHHIPAGERHAALATLHGALRRGGLFAFWENNPWNLGTRYVMARCEFDHDAVPISPPRARALLRAAGFQLLRTDSLFYFPAMLRWLRALEPALRRLPLGGQYLVFCRKT